MNCAVLFPHFCILAQDLFLRLVSGGCHPTGGMSSRYAAKAAYRCENPSAAAGALASDWILRRWRCWSNASLLRKEGLTKTCFRRSSFLNKDNHASRGYLLKIQSLAVRGGFEPPEPLRVRQFSKLLVSATHPSHRVGSAKVVIFY